MTHDPDTIFDLFSEQIMRTHIETVRQYGITPELRSVMTWGAAKLFARSEFIIEATYRSPIAMFVGVEFEFRGSKTTIIPGEDVFFHTRVANLPK